MDKFYALRDGDLIKFFPTLPGRDGALVIDEEGQKEFSSLNLRLGDPLAVAIFNDLEDGDVAEFERIDISKID